MNSEANSKHTPGPWHNVQDHTGDPRAVYAADGEIVAEHVHNKADARLIADAPDTHNELVQLRASYASLLAELQHLVLLLQPLEQAGTLAVPGLATLNGARVAIAKATKE